MRWLTIFRGNSHQGWMPVNNSDNFDATGMDDLMRMAAGTYENDEEDDDVCLLHPTIQDASGRNRNNNQRRDEVDSDEAVFQHNNVSASQLQSSSERVIHLSSSRSSSASSSHQSHSTVSSTNMPEGGEHKGLLCKIFCFCGLPEMVFPKCKWYLMLLSITVTLLFIGLSVGLGVYSLLFYKTDQLVIDKSVKSFSIPNHEVYKHFEALMMARKYNSSVRRHKRSSGHASAKSSLDFTPSHEYAVNSQLKYDSLLQHKAQMIQGTKYLKNKPSSAFKPSTSRAIPTKWSSSVVDGIKDLFQRVKRSAHQINCLFEYQSVARWKMHVIYLAQGDQNSNMFTRERLETVHKIEKRIIQHPQFHDFCLRDPSVERYDPAVSKMHGCTPLNSLMTYFYPSKDEDGNIYYDGMGSNLDDIESALQLAMNHETFYYYVDEKINKTYKKSHFIRSEVLFGAPLQGYCVQEHSDIQNEKFKNFVITYINLMSSVSTEKVRVLYGGNEIFDYEVSSSFWNDIHLAIISFIAIFVLMLVLSMSLYLTIAGIIVIMLSFPKALFFYRVVFGINALGILNGAAAFVIIGIGVDDVFVFVNIYRQSAYMQDPISRIKYTVKTAGVATFFTSFTTAAAFAANLASSIPAVYEFGLFMSLIVSSCWVSVIVLMPPMLYVYACWFEPIEQCLFSCFSCCVGNKKQGAPTISALDEFSVLEQSTSSRHLYEDDDVPMLDVFGSEEPSGQSELDDELLLANSGRSCNEADPGENSLNVFDSALERTTVPGSQEEVSTSFHSMSNNNMCLGRIFQRIIMFMTNRIVIKGRFVVIGLYVVVLIVSCFLMIQLKPASHPPQLFRPDTNLQRLLDLKANFSIIDTLHCDRCSGLYKVHSVHEKEAKPPPIHPKTPSHPHHPAKNLVTTPKPAQIVKTTTPLANPVTPSPSQLKSDPLDSFPLPGKDYAALLPLQMLGFGLAKLMSGLRNHSKTSVNTEVINTPGSITPKPAVTTTAITPSSVHHHAATAKTGQRNHQASTDGGKQKKATSEMVDEVVKDAMKKMMSQVHQLHPQWFGPQSHSAAKDFDACKGQSCNHVKDRPLMESGATVFVVFGIEGVDRSREDIGHVLDSFKSKPIFDPKFGDAFNLAHLNKEHLRELCKVCHILANKTELVKPGSAQCLPSGSGLYKLLYTIKECRNLPSSHNIYHHQPPAHAEGGISHDGKLIWIAFAFESTTKEGQAYFEAYKQYLKWEDMIQHIKKDILSPDSPLQTIFQTSEFWTKVMMEVVAVNSAIYGLALSMLICVVAVAVFTGHLMLLVIIVVTITVMICLVVGIFYLAGWEMGAVEAVSLSILVGSSVDYCVHVVEGYILAWKNMPASVTQGLSNTELRKQRASLAVRHIGVAIISSALTTIIAAIPLTQTTIQPFSKFGSILLINTSVSMLATLTLTVALLASFAPARFRSTWKAHLIAFAVVVVIVGLLVLALYIASMQGVHIPGPSGLPLFS